MSARVVCLAEGGVSVYVCQVVSAQGGVCQGGCLPRGMSARGCVCQKVGDVCMSARGCLPRGCLPRGCVS